MELAELNECTGCWACASACPKGCISMEPDSEGFLRPRIDADACVECGLCRRACPVLTPPAVPQSIPKAYGAVCTDETVRQYSTSGGVFTLLCRWVFARGGTVFGAAYDGDFVVKHCRVDREEELPRLRGAKYAQSSLEDIFPQVKALLEQGKYVLFSGTPCQAGGLRAYLGKEWDRLVLVDVICHGVPSPAVWEHYIQYRSQTDAGGARPAAINLRSKETGWPEYSVRFDYENGAHYMVKNSVDPFLRAFVGDFCLRPSCYECRFKGLSRCSDFTLGDYWGVWNQMPEFHDGKGVSLVLVHSAKARQIWEEISQALRCREAEPDAAVRENPSAVSSSPRPQNRERFMKRYRDEAYWVLTEKLKPIKEASLKKGGWKQILRRIRNMFD